MHHKLLNNEDIRKEPAMTKTMKKILKKTFLCVLSLLCAISLSSCAPVIRNVLRIALGLNESGGSKTEQGSGKTGQSGKSGQSGQTGNDSKPSRVHDVVYVPDEDHIKTNMDYSAVYVDNVMMVCLNREISDDEADRLAKLIDGKVVGRLTGRINLLQILVDDCGFEDLLDMSDELERESVVSYASYTAPVGVVNEGIGGYAGAAAGAAGLSAAGEALVSDAGAALTADVETFEAPDTPDWWARAIDAYTAWQYLDYAKPITVGIVDNGFDLQHEDLTDRFGNPVLTMIGRNSINWETDTPGHGTHVAGLIAAQHNGIGINGMAPDSYVVCTDWLDESTIYRLYPEMIMAFYKRTAEWADSHRTPFVINNSWAAFRDIADKYLPRPDLYEKPSVYRGFADRQSLYLSRLSFEILRQLLNTRGQDFLIVKSAGNGYKRGNASVGDGYDVTNMDWFTGITEENYKRFSDVQEHSFRQYKDHVLVVGAVEHDMKDGAWKAAAFSNYGQAVDIFAPGVNICSTIEADKYGYLSGTSMAGPIAAGTAALVWSMNPGMTAGTVKSYLLDYSGKAVGAHKEDRLTNYRMLNAGSAVAHAAGGGA